MSQLAEIALSRAIAFVATVVLVLFCGTGATAGAPTRVLAGSSATVSLEAGDVVASPLATCFAAHDAAAAVGSPSRADVLAADAGPSTQRPAAFMKKFEDDDSRDATQPGGAPLVVPAGRAPSLLACLDDSPRSTTPIDAVSEVRVPPLRVHRAEGARAPPLA
jgi:hypothetical protein